MSHWQSCPDGFDHRIHFFCKPVSCGSWTGWGGEGLSRGAKEGFERRGDLASAGQGRGVCGLQGFSAVFPMTLGPKLLKPGSVLGFPAHFREGGLFWRQSKALRGEVPSHQRFPAFPSSSLQRGTGAVFSLRLPTAPHGPIQQLLQLPHRPAGGHTEVPDGQQQPGEDRHPRVQSFH